MTAEFGFTFAEIKKNILGKILQKALQTVLVQYFSYSALPKVLQYFFSFFEYKQQRAICGH